MELTQIFLSHEHLTKNAAKMSPNFEAFSFKGNDSESIYLHRSGPLLENGPDRPKNRCGGYGFASFSSISISTEALDGARVFSLKISFLALRVVVVDILQFQKIPTKFPARCP